MINRVVVKLSNIAEDDQQYGEKESPITKERKIRRLRKIKDASEKDVPI